MISGSASSSAISCARRRMALLRRPPCEAPNMPHRGIGRQRADVCSRWTLRRLPHTGKASAAAQARICDAAKVVSCGTETQTRHAHCSTHLGRIAEIAERYGGRRAAPAVWRFCSQRFLRFELTLERRQRHGTSAFRGPAVRSRSRASATTRLSRRPSFCRERRATRVGGHEIVDSRIPVRGTRRRRRRRTVALNRLRRRLR